LTYRETVVSTEIEPDVLTKMEIGGKDELGRDVTETIELEKAGKVTLVPAKELGHQGTELE
jgi:hypothetical protein